MHRQTLRIATACGTFICCTAIGLVTAEAQTRTTVTIHRPLRLPDVVLSPGRYEFHTLDDATGAVLISSSVDGHRFQSTFGQLRTLRPKRGSTFGMRAAVVGSIPEMASWYPGGDTVGYVFATSASPTALSVKDLDTLDKRLEVANTAVVDAKEQLEAAQTGRDAIRTQRAGIK